MLKYLYCMVFLVSCSLGLSGLATAATAPDQPIEAAPEKIWDARTPGDAIDEGCLKADSVTILVNPALAQIVVRYYARQIGIYRLYSTTNSHNDGTPPGVDWTLEDSITVNAPGAHQWSGSYSAAVYKNFVVRHTCSLAPNDNCGNAQLITAGSYPFSTIGATTDGPAEAQCLNAGDNQVGQDIWYRYVATCSGP